MLCFKNSWEFYILFHKYLHICVTIKIIIPPNLLSKTDAPGRCVMLILWYVVHITIASSTLQGFTHLMQVGGGLLHSLVLADLLA